MTSNDQRVSCRLVRLLVPVLNAHPRPVILEPTVRAALLIDLALDGALVDAGEQLEVDTTPTGFAPADRLLAAVLATPDRSITSWLYHDPVGTRDVVEALVDAGTLRHHGPLRHLVDEQPQVTLADANRVADAGHGHRTTAPGTVALVALLALIPGQPRPSRQLSGSAASAQWLLPQLVGELDARRREIDASMRAIRQAGFIPSGPP